MARLIDSKVDLQVDLSTDWSVLGFDFTQRSPMPRMGWTNGVPNIPSHGGHWDPTCGIN